jgi:DNA polymerase-3 subunit alpha
MSFAHLHCHTQFSLLDGAASISALFKKAVKDGMPALAITDHGNMFGVFDFVAEAAKYNKDGTVVKPIVGCEFYLVENRHKRTFTGGEKDRRYHQLLLAKNALGYRNLVKLCSLGYIEGLYSKYPRIDKELLLQYREGLIATTCCLGARVPQLVLTDGEAAAEKEFQWWLDLFGEDYYVELQRHGMKEQDQVNEVLVRFAKKYGVKVIASNDSHYVEQDDYNAHDILLCINTGEKQSTPGFDDFVNDDAQAKNRRFKFPNNQFFFKTREEMGRLFADMPEALENTLDIVGKVDMLKLKQDILLPHFQIPETYRTQDEYLRHLTYAGAKERYKILTPEIEERLNFELATIENMGFAGYFLIVADFIRAGRDLGVFVGPGRGSAAGSAVAYCTGITNIDPIKYGLLFERFLNPDRKSMPDIDTDFDDEGRDKVIKYVVDKYGRNQVAQIVTYGTMAAKMSIKDVARVLDLPLSDANTLAKFVPEKPGIELNRVIFAPLTGEKSLSEKENLGGDDLENCKRLREILADKSRPESDVLREAVRLEGSVRNTGIHAAGIIIAPKDLTEIIPVFTSKDTDLFITQFEGKVIEDAGVIKMDFLGLKTLSIIRDALKLIEQNHGVQIEPDLIPLDDANTYALYQRGETNGTFQFESVGMQKYLRELRPDKFEDLIAMNALYRPGPLEYIPNFIARKHGREQVTYDLAAMKDYLEETYGITVYQEQVMLLSQKLANFTKGDADTLRKAMGKKQKDVLDKMKGKFMAGCEANGHDLKICEKVWTDWEAFASYAFNKSHSTCYAFVAFQTGYLKANFPPEYMAAVLTHSGNIEKITFFLEECKRMGLNILGPDVNESLLHFSVNKKGQIRFGMSALKGVGEGPVADILRAREDGPFTDLFDFARRVSGRSMNKRVLESLVNGGALDCFGLFRAQYFAEMEKGGNFLEALLKYASALQKDKMDTSASLFGGMASNETVPEPKPPRIEEFGLMEKLGREKEITGFYLSGHPLDDYKLELLNFATPIERMDSFRGREVTIGGIVAEASHRVSKKGLRFGSIRLQDFSGTTEVSLFNESYLKHEHLLREGEVLLVKGKFQPRWGNESEFEFRVSSIQQMASVGTGLTESITVKIPVERLTNAFIDDIEKICQAHPGKHKLKMSLETEGLVLPLISKSLSVQVSNPLIQEFEKRGLSYKLN